MNKVNQMNLVGKRVFCDSEPTLSYDFLVEKALAPNTYRGFHKISKTDDGAKKMFVNVLSSNSNYILSTLKLAKSEIEVDELEEIICKELREKLKKNIKGYQLASYNKLRKPTDIFIEHLMAMDITLSSARKTLVGHLYLPLDSQIFKSDFIFTEDERRSLKIGRHFTFKDIHQRSHYLEIQEFLKNKAKTIGLENRIFFDLEWNDRWKSSGSNLFETNPSKKSK
jgi:hypothetical protein